MSDQGQQQGEQAGQGEQQGQAQVQQYGRQAQPQQQTGAGQAVQQVEQPISEQSKPTETQPGDGLPHVGRALDGSEYLDVVEEQQYADQRPSPAERDRQHEKT